MDALQICYDFAPAKDVRRPESKRKATQMGFTLWRVSTDIGTVDFLMQQTVYVSQHEFEVRTEHYRLSFVGFFLTLSKTEVLLLTVRTDKRG